MGLLYLYLYFIQQSLFGEADSSSASQEFTRILSKANVHYRAHKSLSPFPILSQINPDYTTPLIYLSRVHKYLFKFSIFKICL